MTIAYWCVLIAGLMPLIWTATAKLHGSRYDNKNPRGWLAKQDGICQRANNAQLNSFEAFPFFAAGVIIGHLAGANQNTLNLLAIAYISLRLVYGVLYIANLSALRTLAWVAAKGCVVAMFIIAA